MPTVVWQDWFRVGTVAAVGVVLAWMGALVATAEPASPWVVGIFAACVVLLFNQPLILDLREHVIAIDLAGIVVLVGLVALSPVQLLLVWVGGLAVGWLVDRYRERVPPTSALAWLKLSLNSGVSLAHVGGVLVAFELLQTVAGLPLLLAAAASVAVGQVLGVLLATLGVGRRLSLSAHRIICRMWTEPLILMMMVIGGLAVLVIELGGDAALLVVVAAASLWGLAWGHNRRQSELRHRRAFVGAIQHMPTTGDREEVAAVLMERARELTHAGRVSLDAEPPSHGSIGVSVAEDGLWLNVHDRMGDAECFRRREHESLEGLGAVGRLALRAADLAQQLRQAVVHDPLTGALSRRGLEEQWAPLVRRAARRGRGVGVIYIDLDGFKQVNDQHGHAAGDEVLRQTVRRLAAVARETDLVCRLGGDEFVVIADDLVDRAGLDLLRARVADALAEGDAGILASIGTAFHRPWNLALEDALRPADERMYEQKRARRPIHGGC